VSETHNTTTDTRVTVLAGQVGGEVRPVPAGSPVTTRRSDGCDRAQFASAHGPLPRRRMVSVLPDSVGSQTVVQAAALLSGLMLRALDHQQGEGLTDRAVRDLRLDPGGT
jgi:hypothetical protein